jgi:hypothetical protein
MQLPRKPSFQNVAAVQDKQVGFEQGDVNPSPRREAPRNQRCDIQPGVGTDGYGRRGRRVDARAEHLRDAPGAGDPMELTGKFLSYDGSTWPW